MAAKRGRKEGQTRFGAVSRAFSANSGLFTVSNRSQETRTTDFAFITTPWRVR